MSNYYSEHFQHEMQPDRGSDDLPISNAGSVKLAIEELSEDTRELSDEQSKAISGGRSGFDLIDEQLESIVRNLAIGGIRIIGF